MLALQNSYNTLQDYLRLAFAQLRPETRRQKVASIATACLAVAGFAVYVLACWSYKYGDLPDFIGKGLFSEQDGGMMEMVGYIMTACTIVIMTNIVVSQKQRQWLPFIAILFLVLIDDMFQIHSAIGILLEAKYGMQNYTSDFLAFMFLGIFVSALWIWGLRICPKERVQRQTYFLFSGYLALLIFFGVFFDAFDVYMVIHYDVSQTLLGVIEEGCEMVLMCLMALTALSFQQTVTHARKKNG